MSGEHYFSASPSVAEQRRRVPVTLAGRDVEVLTAAGVFSADRVDLGTRVLLREVPDPPATGDLLDLGCGWGPIALTMAIRSPGATVWAVDVNERARELTAANAAQLGLRNVRTVAPQAVPDDVRFAAIWSNPPIRIGKPALHAVLLDWLPRLAEGACAHLVVQRNLGADSLQAWLADRLGGNGSGAAGLVTAVDPDDLPAVPDGPTDARPATSRPVGVRPLQVRRAGSAKGFRVLAVCG